METDVLAAPESAQIEDINQIKRKMHFSGKVIKTTLAGAVIDIGLDTPGVVHISQLQTGPVNRVEDVVQAGQIVDVWVRRVVPKKNRIELTMIKPLDLEWGEIAKDMVLKGKVTRLEKFGVFVEIGAERPGLVHVSEITHGYIKDPTEAVKEGDEVEVKVLNVNRQKKQIKLSMKALEEPPVKPSKPAKQSEQTPAATNPTEEVKESPVPTAMEMALREAMERSRELRGETIEEKGKGKHKSKSSTNELEQILSRTLQHKVRTKS